MCCIWCFFRNDVWFVFECRVIVVICNLEILFEGGKVICVVVLEIGDMRIVLVEEILLVVEN